MKKIKPIKAWVVVWSDGSWRVTGKEPVKEDLLEEFIISRVLITPIITKKK